MKNLWEQICKSIDNCLGTLEDNFGIVPSVSVVLFVILLLLLILIISNAKKHKKLKAQAEASQEELEKKIQIVASSVNKKEEKPLDKNVPGIIYIDNRQVNSEDRAKAEEIRDRVEEVIVKTAEDSGYENLMKDLASMEKEEPLVEVEKRPMYLDRTSGISKNGTEYTEEQLRKQIKE
ncbi:MAG: hypothetical protein MJ146_05385 [Clostridia bacterium]|nr:hypothetical protein [Clostridia bacterium]